ncbi:BglG family transcription antiterminator LicT [Bacillus chungangensis]|uniref:Beta-glucoside operon transcriptional antiterminator n=1 Tax=Bacillus chungangensis TaxID=587633 RepID=A0ABT9WNM4_9BACI|nr:PRD domain-containing protein [Bacillus chungangensis]MDQ0174876.1 beta-glucoside operon transcriptional antiterminator [Bacillus chungangensis]
MIIKKVFNNNVVLVVDSQGIESILMGKGIGFQKFPKDAIDESLIEKRFDFNSGDGNIGKFSELFSHIPEEDIRLADEIIQFAESELQQKLNQNVLATLSDHISYMLQRAKDDAFLKSPLQWEIQQLYPKEYQVSLQALKIIQEKTGISFLKSEAASIALHFVNAQVESDGMEETVLCTDIIGKILDIMFYHYQIEIEKDSFNYTRFITHLRYFVKRQMAGNVMETDNVLLDTVKVKYDNDYACALRIKDFLKEKYRWIVSSDEMLYLTLHIHRVTSRTLS